MEDTEKKEVLTTERIYTFDIIRGIAIMLVVVFHRMLWDYFFPNYTGGEPPLGLSLLVLFLTMAGIFYVISGAVNSYMIHKRLSSGRSSVREVILGGWITGIILISFNVLLRSIFSRTIDDVTSSYDNATGFLTYFILYGNFPEPLVNPGNFIDIDTLAMIGITIIFISTLLGLIYKWTHFENPKKIYILLMVIGTLIMVVTPFLRLVIGFQTASDAFNADNYILAIMVFPLTSGYFPIFPYLSYGCFGAIFGIAIAREEKPRKVKLALGLLALTFFILGILTYRGEYGIPGYEVVSWESNVSSTGRKLVQLGLFFILILIGLHLLDYRDKSVKEKWVSRTRIIREYGKLSLTIYMFEGILAVLLQKLISPFWLEWNVTFLNITILGLINLFTWLIILELWKRVDYKGSLEWCIVWIVQKLSGKKSSRFKS
jgi:peptidoglycan/LPS O-acetylase OafA/YrhL